MEQNNLFSYEWSITIYEGESLDKLHPISDADTPHITSKDVTDVVAEFVADPFMHFSNGIWHMYFEVLNKATGLGEIGYATSHNLSQWTYKKIVLREPFHLSYPMIFKFEGELYMVPETRNAQEIRLYKSTGQYDTWNQVAVLVNGDYADATLFQHNGKWWMYALNGTDDLHLFFSNKLYGPWQLHPSSPIVKGDKRISRPGGTVIKQKGGLYRVTQDGIPLYGSRVRMMKINEISNHDYSEEESENSPILEGSRKGWNAIGMHHIDAHLLKDGTWVACVDGAKPNFKKAPAFNSIKTPHTTV